MGNRNGSARRKGARESAYSYSETRRDDYAGQKSNPGSINRRAYPNVNSTYQQQQSSQSQYQQQQQHHPHPHSYQHQHSNGYSGNQSVSSTGKNNASKVIYIANYDFNGTTSTGELSFRKDDRLEILDRYS